jgi:hypothetical protein
MCRSLPQEEIQLTVSRANLDEHIRMMNIHVTRKFAELVFNLDEFGSADWEDRKGRNVIVHAPVRNEDVYHCVSHRQSHATLLACVSAVGDAMTPLLISANPIRDLVWSKRVPEDEDVMVRRRTPAYSHDELFFEHISSMFIPYVSSVCSRLESAD